MGKYTDVNSVRLALTPNGVEAEPERAETAAVLSDSQIEDAILEAEGIVASYLRSRYTIPSVESLGKSVFPKIDILNPGAAADWMPYEEEDVIFGFYRLANRFNALQALSQSNPYVGVTAPAFAVKPGQKYIATVSVYGINYETPKPDYRRLYGELRVTAILDDMAGSVQYDSRNFELVENQIPVFTAENAASLFDMCRLTLPFTFESNNVHMASLNFYSEVYNGVAGETLPVPPHIILVTDPDVREAITAAPEPVRGWTRDIAAFLCALTFRKNKDLPEDDPIRLRYRHVMDMLDKVLGGKMSLDLPSAGGDNGDQDVTVVNLYEGKMFDFDDVGLGYDGNQSQNIWPARRWT